MARIFISYRREEAAKDARRLYADLAARFGASNVFLDIEMEPGRNFVDTIRDFIASSDVVLALIGPRWAAAQDAGGARRLENPHDFVRLELESALDTSTVRVIPVLLQGARMPSVDDLPASLVRLAWRHGVALDDAGWGQQVKRLVAAIERDGPDTGRPPPAAPRRLLAAATAGMLLALAPAVGAELAVADLLPEGLYQPLVYALGWGVRWALVGLGAGALTGAVAGGPRGAVTRAAALALVGALAGAAGGAVRGWATLDEVGILDFVAAFSVVGVLFGAVRPACGSRAGSVGGGLLGGIAAGVLVGGLAVGSLEIGVSGDAVRPVLSTLVVGSFTVLGGAAGRATRPEERRRRAASLRDA